MLKRIYDWDYSTPIEGVILFSTLFMLIGYFAKIDILTLVIICANLFMATLIVTNITVVAICRHGEKKKHHKKEKHISLEKVLAIEKPFAINETTITKDFTTNVITTKDVTNMYWSNLTIINYETALLLLGVILCNLFGILHWNLAMPMMVFAFIVIAFLIFMAYFAKKTIEVPPIYEFKDSEEILLKYYFFKDMIVIENPKTTEIKIIPRFDIVEEYTRDNMTFGIYLDNYKLYHFIINADGFVEDDVDNVRETYIKMQKKK